MYSFVPKHFSKTLCPLQRAGACETHAPTGGAGPLRYHRGQRWRLLAAPLHAATTLPAPVILRSGCSLQWQLPCEAFNPGTVLLSAC